MRPLILLSLLASVAACDSGSSTTPASTVISVRVVDDAGAPVDRTPVRVMLASGTRLDEATRNDGSVTIRLPDAGTYQVWIVPRAGYIGNTPSLMKSVAAPPGSKAVVEFTVYRQGSSTQDPPEWAR